MAHYSDSNRAARCALLMFAILALVSQKASAHLLVNNAMDVVIGKSAITVDARISLNQVRAVEPHGLDEPTDAQWSELVANHRRYLLSHLHVYADGHELSPLPLHPGTQGGTLDHAGNSGKMGFYHIEYPLATAPALVRIDQNCLEDVQPSDADFVLRIRQEDEKQFETQELHRDNHAEFDCTWSAGPATRVQATDTRVDFKQTALAFLKAGIWHILTGYDHLLFVSGLVLAATSLWDLIKVVGAFTVAHSITLTLCVFNLVNLSDLVVEPMISASIMLVALQNIFYPKQSTGWARIGIAFGFGLFHGLGFAGGLKDAMSDLPAMALWTSLISFSLGVEIGHQTVVLPLFFILRAIRKPRTSATPSRLFVRIQKWGSATICIAGGYFFWQAIHISK